MYQMPDQAGMQVCDDARKKLDRLAQLWEKSNTEMQTEPEHRKRQRRQPQQLSASSSSAEPSSSGGSGTDT